MKGSGKGEITKAIRRLYRRKWRMEPCLPSIPEKIQKNAFRELTTNNQPSSNSNNDNNRNIESNDSSSDDEKDNINIEIEVSNNFNYIKINSNLDNEDINSNNSNFSENNIPESMKQQHR